MATPDQTQTHAPAAATQAGADRGTMCAAFQETAARAPDRVALQTLDGERRFTYAEYAERVRSVAAGLHALDVGHGDTIALMLSNRPEFHFVDTAATHLGAVPFSMYNTSSPEQVKYLVADSDARVLVTEKQFVDKLRPATEERGSVEHLVVVDGADELSLDEVEEGGAQAGSDFDFEATWRAVEPDDLLTLIYTSGTTGPPKGVQLTHRNSFVTGHAYAEMVEFPEGADVVSYLPMAHIAERNCSHNWAQLFGFTVTCCPDPREIGQALLHVRPHWFFAVPRIFEKLRSSVENHDDDAVREAAARGAARVRGEDGPEPDPEVLATVRERLGLDRVGSMIIGGTPVQVDLIQFFHGLGLRLEEIWAMSETAGLGTANRPGASRIGTVGPAAPGVQLRLAEDNEVEIRGACLMHSYRKRPEETAETFTDDGWLSTGDVGSIDEEGFLSILDRKKEIIINAAGKNMSPSNIESTIKAASSLIGSAVVIGDSRPYNVALLVLDPDAAATFAREHGLDAGRDPAELAQDDAVREAVEQAVERANDQLSRVEQVKRFTLLSAEWTPGGEELTPTMKLKRKPIAERYAEEIEALYA